MTKDLEKIEQDLRNSIFEFTEKISIQSQMSEAFHIWKNDAYSISGYFTEDDIDNETFSKFFDWFIFDFKTFKNRKRVVEEFYDENLDNLEEDEKTILMNWIKSCQSYFEVIKVNHGEFCVIKDLFTNEELLVYDRAVSSKIKTLDIIASRPLKTGDKYFFSGIISVYPSIFKQIIINYFKKEFDIYRADKGDNFSVRNFLKDRAFLIGNYIEDIVNHPQLISVDGDELLVAAAYYTINSKKSVLYILNESAELKCIQNPLDENYFYYMEELEDMIVEANIEISNNVLTITCNTKNKLRATRSFIEGVLGDFINHTNDTIKKLNSYIESSKKSTYKLPKGFKSKKKFESSLDDFYKEWIDQPLDALNGSTPRQALKSTEGRSMLENVFLELERLYDGARKAGEPYYEVSKLRELLQNSLS